MSTTDCTKYYCKFCLKSAREMASRISVININFSQIPFIILENPRCLHTSHFTMEASLNKKISLNKAWIHLGWFFIASFHYFNVLDCTRNLNVFKYNFSNLPHILVIKCKILHFKPLKGQLEYFFKNQCGTNHKLWLNDLVFHFIQLLK